MILKLLLNIKNKNVLSVITVCVGALYFLIVKDDFLKSICKKANRQMIIIIVIWNPGRSIHVKVVCD